MTDIEGRVVDRAVWILEYSQHGTGDVLDVYDRTSGRAVAL